MAVTVKEITDWLDALYPPHWAEDWDQVGLQLGDPGQPVRRWELPWKPLPEQSNGRRPNPFNCSFVTTPYYFSRPAVSAIIGNRAGRSGS